MRNSLLCFVVLLSSIVVNAQIYDSDMNVMMSRYGLVDIQSLDPEILVELKYSTTDNFVGEDMYGDLDRAYFEPEFAGRVVKAQRALKRRYPDYTLLIYDAARPISVQRHMRRVVKGTPFENFVADGTKGGRHNYGVAVDLTIADSNGVPLDMGASFDDFTDAASVKGTPDTDDPDSRRLEVYRSYIMQLSECGIIGIEAANNRILLIEVMLEAGLYPYRREWWHFEEIMSMTMTRSIYQLLDF